MSFVKITGEIIFRNPFPSLDLRGAAPAGRPTQKCEIPDQQKDSTRDMKLQNLKNKKDTFPCAWMRERASRWFQVVYGLHFQLPFLLSKRAVLSIASPTIDQRKPFKTGMYLHLLKEMTAVTSCLESNWDWYSFHPLWIQSISVLITCCCNY